MNSDAEGAAKEPIAGFQGGLLPSSGIDTFQERAIGKSKRQAQRHTQRRHHSGAALRERVVINENGQRKTISKLDAAVKQLVNKAASGDLRALQSLLALLREGEDRDNTAAARTPAMGEADQTVMEGILQRFQRFQGEKEVESEADPE